MAADHGNAEASLKACWSNNDDADVIFVNTFRDLISRQASKLAITFTRPKAKQGWPWPGKMVSIHTERVLVEADSPAT